MKFKAIPFTALILAASLLLGACTGFRLEDALKDGHFETIRYASFFEGASEPLGREEFEVYKEAIIRAIEKEDEEGVEGIRIENTLKGEFLYISPFELTITDLSPDLRIYLNGRELQNDYRSNALKTFLNPGENELRFVLDTGYYENEKTIQIDTESQPSQNLTLASGFGFRTVTVNSQDPGAYLNINGLDYLELKQGANQVEYIPSVPLVFKSVSQDVSSKEAVLSEDQGSVSLELTEWASTQPMVTGSGKTLTQPVATTAPQQGGQKLQGTEADPLVEVSRMLQARANDLNSGMYEETAAFILPGSSLEEDWQTELIPGSGIEHLFLGTEDGRVVILTPSAGYVEVNSRFRTVRPEATPDETFSRSRYYFSVTHEGGIAFYEARPLD